MSLIKDADGGLRVISMSDLIQHPWYPSVAGKILRVKDRGGKMRSIRGIEALLFTLGLDIFLPYESDVLEHRSELTQVVVTCERFVGRKRTDKQWVKQEYQLRYNEI